MILVAVVATVREDQVRLHRQLEFLEHFFTSAPT
jgi:hypothetical protein